MVIYNSIDLMPTLFNTVKDIHLTLHLNELMFLIGILKIDDINVIFYIPI